MWLWLIATGLAAGAGYLYTRNFVRRRLRYVDAIRSPAAPMIAGAAAALVVAPVALLPVVTVGSAIVFGASVAAGVASGRKDSADGSPG